MSGAPPRSPPRPRDDLHDPLTRRPAPTPTAGTDARLAVVNAPESSRRTRGDLCPGVLRPWPAADGALVRLRIPGGRVSPMSLAALGEVAEKFGDDDNVALHITTRANLQIRALPSGPDGQLPAEVVDAIAETGLLPAPEHELVRNILVSPLTGLDGGRADLRQVTTALDAGLVALPELAGLPGRFLFVLDDGRGDLIEQSCDLGLVALDAETAQLRVGENWAGVVPLAEAAEELVGLARAFVRVRGGGPDAPWHVRELTADLRAELTVFGAPDPRLPAPIPPLPYGPVSGASTLEHVEAPDGVLDRDLIGRLTSPDVRELIVTPWRGVLVVPA